MFINRTYRTYYNDYPKLWVTPPSSAIVNIPSTSSSSSYVENWSTSSSSSGIIPVIIRLGDDGLGMWTATGGGRDGAYLVAGRYGGDYYDVGTLWTSNNAGVSFTERVGVPCSGYNVGCSLNGKYILTVQGYNDAYNHSIFVSNDYGSSFTETVLIPAALDVFYYFWYNACAMSDSGQYMYVANKDDNDGGLSGIWASNNYGVDWTKTASATGYDGFLGVACSSDGRYVGACSTVYDSTNPYVLISNNYGETWSTTFTSPYGGQSANIYAITCTPNGQTWWIEVQKHVSTGEYTSNDEKHFYKSTNYGVTWNEISVIVTDRSVNYVHSLNCSADGDALILTIGGTNLGEKGIWASVNSGQSWRKISTLGKFFGIATISESLGKFFLGREDTTNGLYTYEITPPVYIPSTSSSSSSTEIRSSSDSSSSSASGIPDSSSSSASGIPDSLIVSNASFSDVVGTYTYEAMATGCKYYIGPDVGPRAGLFVIEFGGDEWYVYTNSGIGETWIRTSGDCAGVFGTYEPSGGAWGNCVVSE